MLALGLCLLSYFSYHALAGQRSVINYISLKKENVALQAQLEDMRAKRNAIEHKVSMLRPGSIDPDYVHELAVINLGYSRSNHLTIINVNK